MIYYIFAVSTFGEMVLDLRLFISLLKSRFGKRIASHETNSFLLSFESICKGNSNIHKKVLFYFVLLQQYELSRLDFVKKQKQKR